MGTETTSPMLQPFQTHQAAQLNLLIPIRGRKHTGRIIHASIRNTFIVKLNNPQMGTETYGPHYSCFYTEHLYS